MDVCLFSIYVNACSQQYMSVLCAKTTYAVIEQLCLSTVTFIPCLVSDGKISFMVTVEFWNYVWKLVFINSLTLCSGIFCLKWNLKTGKWSLFSPLWTGFRFFLVYRFLLFSCNENFECAFFYMQVLSG